MELILPQSWSLLPAAGLCHFATLALALLALLGALAPVDTQKMIRAQCGVRPTACYSFRFLRLPALSLSHGLQSPQVGMGPGGWGEDGTRSEEIHRLSLGSGSPSRGWALYPGAQTSETLQVWLGVHRRVRTVPESEWEEH